MSFVHTHLHTEYSVRDAISSPSTIAKRVKELGQPGFIITDHGTSSGLMAGYNAVQELNKESKENGDTHMLKFGFGCEMYFVPDCTMKTKGYYHIILIAKDNKGYQNLLKLITLANQPDNFYSKPRIDYEMLKEYSEGLICTTACIGGLLKLENNEMWLKRFKHIFGSDLYIEILTTTIDGQKEFNQDAVRLAKKFEIDLLATCDSHYVLKEEASTHRRWKEISDNDESAYYQTDDFYIMEEYEVSDRLLFHGINIKDVNNAIDNTVKILDKCNVVLDFKTKHYPDFPIPEGFASQLEYLKYLTIEGAKKKLSHLTKDIKQIYWDRMKYELDVLEKAEYINYFLITHDILNWCHRNGIYTDPGRGSVTASLVSYLMGITKIDPIKYGLIFERFAHLERVTPPDIDVDVPKSRRREVIDYVRIQYGEVYQVRNFGFMAEAGSRQKARQSLGLEKDTPESLKLASKFEGTLQNYGCHASAVIIIPGDPSQFCAIERQLDNKTGEIRYVAAYDFHDLEHLGILKQDILGLKTCDVIQKTCEEVGLSWDFIDNLPDDDEKTFAMLRAGGTSGCFQIESYGMTDTVRRIQPESIWDLVPLVALYRPGPKDAKLPGTEYTMLDAYIMRRSKEMDTEYLHPLLIPILSPTYGIILYQEQILAIARDLCGYTLGQADVLRRIIGRKEVEKIQEAINEMVQRGEKNGIDGETMHKICDQIVTFAKYGFNQGHSTAYGYVAYQTAYLKAHYPLQFMWALINSEDNKHENIIPYIKECGNINIKVLPPHINLSDDDWKMEGQSLRIGIRYIKHVGALNLNEDVESLSHLMEVCPHANKRVLEYLTRAGALDCLGERVQLMLDINGIDSERDRLKKKISDNLLKIDSLTEQINTANPLTKKYQTLVTQRQNRHNDNTKTVEKIDELEELADSITKFDEITEEIEALGFSYKDRLIEYDLSETDEYNPDSILDQIIGAECLKVKPYKTKKGKPMAFLSLRTQETMIEACMFDFLLKKRGDMVVGNIYIVSIKEGIVRDFEPAIKK